MMHIYKALACVCVYIAPNRFKFVCTQTHSFPTHYYADNLWHSGTRYSTHPEKYYTVTILC